MKIRLIAHSIIIYSMFYVGSCLAQDNSAETPTENLDVSLTDPLLSLKYQRGRFLVYDCLDKHWVCTAESEFDLCLEQREVGLLDKNMRMPCGAFSSFKDEKSCQKYQTKLINRGEGSRFCMNIESDSIEKTY